MKWIYWVNNLKLWRAPPRNLGPTDGAKV